MDILRILKLAVLVAATAALTTASVLMVTQARVPAVAVGPAPCVDGDANGDSSLDIGDPIYLLGHLFGGGPAPVACAQTTPDDIAAAVDAALGRYLPRAGELYFNKLLMNVSEQFLEVVVVPPGKVLRLTTCVAPDGVLPLNGVPFYPIVHPPSGEMLYPELMPGDTLVWHNGPSTTVSGGFSGHWLDYTP